jgi:hypothetical protein
MASHFDFVRLASIISVNTCGAFASLWATTVPTPPAPMINTLAMMNQLPAFMMDIQAKGKTPLTILGTLHRNGPSITPLICPIWLLILES